jgi:hypothetical protein
MIEMNPIIANINEDNLSEIIMEEIIQLDDTEIGKYAENVVTELFHNLC